MFDVSQQRREYSDLARHLDRCLKRLDQGKRPEPFDEANMAEAASLVFTYAETQILDQFDDVIRERDDEIERAERQYADDQRLEDRLNRSY